MLFTPQRGQKGIDGRRLTRERQQPNFGYLIKTKANKYKKMRKENRIRRYETLKFPTASDD